MQTTYELQCHQRIGSATLIGDARRRTTHVVANKAGKVRSGLRLVLREQGLPELLRGPQRLITAPCCRSGRTPESLGAWLVRRHTHSNHGGNNEPDNAAACRGA
jgi:hypothetical protein